MEAISVDDALAAGDELPKAPGRFRRRLKKASLYFAVAVVGLVIAAAVILVLPGATDSRHIQSEKTGVAVSRPADAHHMFQIQR